MEWEKTYKCYVYNTCATMIKSNATKLNVIRSIPLIFTFLAYETGNHTNQFAPTPPSVPDDVTEATEVETQKANVICSPQNHIVRNEI